MIVGFTGTQKGMTSVQIDTFCRVFRSLDPIQLHHGDCIGADEYAHNAALILGIPVVLHPPDVPTKRSFLGKSNMPGAQITTLDEKPYLDRNKDIVDASDILIATPRSAKQVVRSGTWATVRYAQSKRKIVVLI